METIYLVGQISPADHNTYKWRKDVREFFWSSPMFNIIDPCDNGFNGGAKKEFASKDVDPKLVYHTKGIDILPSKDLSCVLKSTIAFANLNVYDPNKIMVGPFFELAWYYMNPGKTVIGIYDGNPEEAIQCKHPFVQQAVTTWVKDHKEACDLTLYYFGGTQKCGT